MLARISYAHMKNASRSRAKPRRAPHAPARRVRKAPTNLSLRIDLVERAKALDLNLSEVVETALEQAIVAAEQARWLAENEAAIDYYNKFIEENGVFGEEFRDF